MTKTNFSKLDSQIDSHRQQFPALKNKTYFNYGGQGPMPQASLNIIVEGQTQIQQQGPFGIKVNEWIKEEIATTRSAIASELGIKTDTLTLTENVTAGCNIAMWGIPWHKGDHLLLSDCEHPGIIAMAEEIAYRFDVEVTTCPLMATLNEGDPVEIIAQHLRPQTRLLVLSHVLWNTGQVLPLDEIVQLCQSRQQQVKVLVDAAQSVGMLPLNLRASGVDFYAFTGHKWLCGPGGVGGLYVRPEIRDNLRPTFVGWRSILTDKHAQPMGWQPDGQRYEIATSHYPLYAGLREAIAIHQKWGTPEERYQEICSRSEYLWSKLVNLSKSNIQCLRTSPPESGLVSFQLKTNKPNVSNQLVTYLELKGFLLRTILDPDCVRACVHYFTLESEMDDLVVEIQNFLDS
ncbi:MAG: aminotransferase class V-fold PLP-dependent enzyme [Cyanobacteria bacterium P01_A01_bin.84]